MEERSKCLQIEVEGELPAMLREATTEVVNFDNHKENSLPRPRFISRFHPSHASTSDLNGLEASSSSASKTLEAHHNEDPGMTINHQRKTSLPMPTSPIDHMIADPTSSSSDNNKNGGSTGKSVKYNSFKTWSGKLESQFTRKPASIPETPNRAKEHLNTNHEAMPVDRYFAP
ncbi:hypothetical protein F2Q68_00012374 [Brassica cretica]|uniref:Uncharacterized protein n=1 Tax=Brassica cretica TaxID=69181 RepID=A0A8S9KR34_BRACR|nr:hypothetical protein F2Q68_00012374 [Brassica cretica]